MQKFSKHEWIIISMVPVLYLLDSIMSGTWDPTRWKVTDKVVFLCNACLQMLFLIGCLIMNARKNKRKLKDFVKRALKSEGPAPCRIYIRINHGGSCYASMQGDGKEPGVDWTAALMMAMEKNPEFCAAVFSAGIAYRDYHNEIL